jgi:hypothetical protein
MTPAQIKNFVCSKLHITSTQYGTDNVPIAEAANAILDDLYGAISWKNLGYFGCYSAVNLTGTVRIYVIPDEILNKIKKIEVKLGGSGEYTWKPLTIKDINDIPDFVFDETWITSHYDNENPVGFIHGNALHILSGQVPAATPGIRYFYLKFPDELTSLDGTFELSKYHDNFGADGQTITIGLPRQFHRLLARGLIVDYKEANEMPLVGREPIYDQDLKTKLDQLSPLSADEGFEANLPSSDGSDL